MMNLLMVQVSQCASGRSWRRDALT